MKYVDWQIVPGVILSFLVALIAKQLAFYFPTIGTAPLAICMGIVIGNTIGRKSIFERGTGFSESKLLQVSVALLGMTVTAKNVQSLGVVSLAYIICMMTSVIILTYLLGRLLGFKEEFSLMIAGGNAVCGSAAIGAIAPAIQAESKDKGEAIVFINLLGTILMFVLPIIGQTLFHFSGLGNAALTGGILQSVAQVVASASLIDDGVVQYALLFKMTRILFLVPVVLAFERWMAKRRKNNQLGHSFVSRAFSTFPIYILIFLCLFTLNSYSLFPSFFSYLSTAIRSWCELIALAAIGLRLDLKSFFQKGSAVVFYMVILGISQLAFSLLFILIFRIGFE